MKKVYIVLSILTLSISGAFAQKIGYVDSEFVIKHVPEYVNAEKQMDELSTQWQKDVDNRYAEIERLYKAYQNDQSLLNEETRRRREDEIVSKEKEVKVFQQEKFGFEGELFKKRAQLIDPIQQRISKAIQEVATAQDLDIVLDKGGDTSFLYAKPGLDKSNEVINKLGYKPNSALAN